METFERGNITLNKLDDYIWEMPQTGGMRVPGRVFASEALLEEIAEDKTLSQLRNAAHLPGMTKYAICMPDGHQGYGFPVGGVGAIDAENGCISPGAIGYDINCHPADTKVQLEFGRYARIEALKRKFEDERAIVASDSRISSDIRLFTESRAKDVYRVETEYGQDVRATLDHPFETPDGMKELGKLDEGDTVFISPFIGLPDEEPPEFTVLTEADFADEDPEVVSSLTKMDMLPMTSTDDTFNRLLGILGFHIGNGSFCGDQTWFFGNTEDLETIRRDIRAIGYRPSEICSRDRTQRIRDHEFQRNEDAFSVDDKGLKVILRKFGVLGEKKGDSGVTLPDWFDRLAGWQQALFLSAYFGAEMSPPKAATDTTLCCPQLSQIRPRDAGDASERFADQIADSLAQLDIATKQFERFDAPADRNSLHHFGLRIDNDSENLIRFFTRIGYRYNREKQQKAMAAVQFLRAHEQALHQREQLVNTVAEVAKKATDTPDILKRISTPAHFVHPTLEGGTKPGRRPPTDCSGFEEFCDELGVRENFTVPVEIKRIEQSGREPVFDIGVSHPDHNFLADGFVVSNCGVRMMKTNLDASDLEGREEELVDALFANIPSGLGGGGVVETDIETIEEILVRGVEWAVDAGWGVDDDLTHCEDEGSRPEADSDAVSDRAKNRGKNQVGSLGSGNHFLEVQRVTDVIREDVADTFGLWEDQIVVMIHCGSRGLGHQVCTDYLREIERTHNDLLSQLPDTELAAAPATSELADEYYHAMGAAINFAWVNRQLVMHRTRQVFERVFNTAWEDLEMDLLYDVAHNIGKKETHTVAGEDRELYVHRKGATRAFPAGRPELPPAYRDVGQPVIIPGSMGTGSYVLRGGERSLELSFGSTAHGAGRLMSRTQAKQEYWGGDVQDELREQDHIYVKAQSGATIAEEAPGVYKNVDEVVRVSDELGIGDTVVRTFPICNIKG